MTPDQQHTLPTCEHGVTTGPLHLARCGLCREAAAHDVELDRVTLYGRGYAAGWQGEGQRCLNLFLDDLEKRVHRDQ